MELIRMRDTKGLLRTTQALNSRLCPCSPVLGHEPVVQCVHVSGHLGLSWLLCPHLEDKIKIIYKAVVRLLTHHSEQKFSLEMSVGPGQNQNSLHANVNYPILNPVIPPWSYTKWDTGC